MYDLLFCGASLVAQMVKNLPAMWETWVPSLGGEDPLEKRMTTHSSILACRIPGQRGLAGYRPWGHKELDTPEQLSLFEVSFATVMSFMATWFLVQDLLKVIHCI